jgi:hypothetical protein
MSIPDRFIVYNATNNQPILDTQWMGFINDRHIYELKKLKTSYPNSPAFNVLDFTGLKGKGKFKTKEGIYDGGATGIVKKTGYDYDNPEVVKGLRRTKGEPQTFKIQKTNDLTKLRLVVYSPLEETMFRIKLSCLASNTESLAKS